VYKRQVLYLASPGASYVTGTTLHVVQHVDKDPVLCQLVAVAAVDIDDAHIGGLAGAGQAKIAACGGDSEVGPAEEAAVIAFCHTGDVAVEGAVGELAAERLLVLLDIALNGEDRADACGAVPCHVVMPCELQFLLWRQGFGV